MDIITERQLETAVEIAHSLFERGKVICSAPAAKAHCVRFNILYINTSICKMSQILAALIISNHQCPWMRLQNLL